jgi:hypothetical protein
MTADHLLLFADHILNEDRKLLYSRAEGVEHISIEDFERFKRFKSGVILDAILLILELSKSGKFYDCLKFYEGKVADMVSTTSKLCQLILFLTYFQQYRTHKHEPDFSQSLGHDFNRALTEIPITLKICQVHMNIINSLEDAVRKHKLVNDADDERLLSRLCNQGVTSKRKEIAKLEKLLKDLQLIRQQVSTM